MGEDGRTIDGGDGAVINASASAKGWLDDALTIIKPVTIEYVSFAQEAAQIEKEFPTEPYPSLVRTRSF